MSVSKWRYTEECNGRPCPGDCDYCSFEPGDLISRADAIEAVKDTILKRFNLADWYEEMLNCGVEIEDRIKALPSAEAVQGEWIKRGTKISCSNCKCAWSTSFDTIVAGMRFCPMCGAKMYKGGDSE